MAITYKFLCNQCEYKDELYIGTTRIIILPIYRTMNLSLIKTLNLWRYEKREQEKIQFRI